jgi:integrase
MGLMQWEGRRESNIFVQRSVEASVKAVQVTERIKNPGALDSSMVEIIRCTEVSLPDRIRDLAQWQVPQATRVELKRFLQELALGKVNRGTRISEGRQAKYLYLLRVPLEFWNKETAAIVEKDIERFESALASDQIKTRSKPGPYSQSTKVDIRKALKIFLRWRLGQARMIQLAGWLDTHLAKKTPDFLGEHEAEQLLRKCRTSEQRYLIAVLFDSGARAQEFLNIRYEDIQLPEGKDNFVKLTLKEEYSKTKGRTISLYWRHSLEAVSDWLRERVRQGLRPGDLVYANTYGGMRMFLRRLGRKVLERHVHPHLLRHSSATFYATKLNRQELCYRYGWRFSSDMPDVYISRAGMENHQLDEKFTQTELATLKDDLVKVTQENQIKSQRIEELQQSVEAMRRNVEMITEVLAANPSVQQVAAALERKRRAV